MAENKKSFVGYADWNKTFEKLSDDEAGKLAKMIFAYVNDENPEAPDRITELIFEPFKNQLKRDLEKYEEVKRKRSEAGRNGGFKSGVSRSNPKQNEANEANASIVEPKEANASFAKKNEANEAVTVNDTVNVNENDNVILLEKETKEENVHFPESQALFSKNGVKEDSVEIPKKVAPKKVFRPPTVQEVQNYCNERKNGISAFSFVNFYQSKDWMIGKNKMKDWQAAVHTWEQKEKENGQSKTAKSLTQAARR